MAKFFTKWPTTHISVHLDILLAFRVYRHSSVVVLLNRVYWLVDTVESTGYTNRQKIYRIYRSKAIALVL